MIRHSDVERARARLDHFLSTPIAILLFDRPSARIHARVRGALRARPIGPHDLIIASIALAHGLRLVTHNTGEFERVPGLELEDWTLAEADEAP